MRWSRLIAVGVIFCAAESLILWILIDAYLCNDMKQNRVKIMKIKHQSDHGVNKVASSPNSLEPVIQSTNYIDALKEVVSEDNMVVLTLVDEGFTPMAVNFYLTCLKPHGIENYLVLTMHPDTCKKLTPYRIKCFQYISSIEGNDEPSRFGSKIFIQKMNVRTDMIVDALKEGFSVLHTDSDVSFMKNPFEHINCSVGHCDLAVLLDGSHDNYNAGFLLVHPSALPVYQRMQQLARNNTRMTDQEQLNIAVRTRRGVKLVSLPKAEFLCGRSYYQDAKRFYADTMKPCPECVVVHNNFIVSYEAKVYRAKEVHQWMYDGDEYYSSTTRKYMTYINGPKPYTTEAQLEALKTGLAVASMLNRTLILPKFYCANQNECPLYNFITIRRFDKHFWDAYREHSFLTHVLVPKSVKSSVFTVTRPVTNVKQTDIFHSFGHVPESMLTFREVNLSVTFTDPSDQEDFDKRIGFSFSRRPM